MVCVHPVHFDCAAAVAVDGSASVVRLSSVFPREGSLALAITLFSVKSSGGPIHACEIREHAAVLWPQAQQEEDGCQLDVIKSHS